MDGRLHNVEMMARVNCFVFLRPGFHILFVCWKCYWALLYIKKSIVKGMFKFLYKIWIWFIWERKKTKFRIILNFNEKHYVFPVFGTGYWNQSEKVRIKFKPISFCLEFYWNWCVLMDSKKSKGFQIYSYLHIYKELSQPERTADRVRSPNAL